MNRRQEIALRVVGGLVASISFFYGRYDDNVVWMLLVPILVVGALVIYGLRQDAPGIRASGSPDQPASQSTGAVNGLERLARLHADGLLTDEEFAAAKRVWLDQ